MSPRPRKAPKARLTLLAPRRPRLRWMSSMLGSAVSSGLVGRADGSVRPVGRPGSPTDGVVTAGSPPVAGVGVPVPVGAGAGEPEPPVGAGRTPLVPVPPEFRGEVP